MIRREHRLLCALVALGLGGHAAAGTLYKCTGGPSDPVNYSSRAVPGLSCKAIGYKGQPSKRTPVAFGYGAGATSSGMTTSVPGAAPAAPATNSTVAASVPIPAAQGAPAIARVAAAPTRAQAASGGGGGGPHVVFHTSDDGLPMAAPAMPVGAQARVTRGVMYKYTTRDGISAYTNIAPPSSAGARVLFTYIETCYACSALPGVNFGRLALNTTAYAAEISSAARAYGVDEWLVRAIIHAESNYNPNAVSHAGAQGLMQLMPGTASRFGVQNAFAASDNIAGGVQYLSFLSKRYNGDVRLIAAAYNAGEGNVDRYGGVPPFSETMRYVERVGTLAERYRGAH